MEKVLESVYQDALGSISSFVSDESIAEKILSICKCESNKAPIRYLMSAMLAKLDNEKVDTRQPYPKLGPNSFPGRTIDETIVQAFIHKYNLPCNDTTAFLTPAFRTIESTLTKSTFENCRPSYVYYEMMDILEYVESHPTEAKMVLSQIVSDLLLIKELNEKRMKEIVAEMKAEKTHELSSEEITTLLAQHLQCKGSSRLPVLMVVAAYQAVQHLTKESPKPLLAHNSADKQTGAIGDIGITLSNEDDTVTCYEMKKKQVSTDDIYVIIKKLSNTRKKPDNYIIITTENITKEVRDLAYSIYGTLGIEVAVLDCLGFINHFLHFFHRYRAAFLDHYQQLVLDEPSSAVSQPLKEAFLSLRKVAESSL